MRKQCKMVVVWVMVLALLLPAVLPASAASLNTGDDVMEALDRLLTATDNLTFQGKASFSYDGQVYRTLEMRQLVDGLKQFREEKTTISQGFLQSYEPAENTFARYLDGAKYHEYFDGIMSSDFFLVSPRRSMVVLDDFQKTLLALGKAASAPLLEGKLLQTEGKASFSLTEQDFPAMLNPLITFAIMAVYTERGFSYGSSTGVEAPEIEYESYDASLQQFARQELGLSDALVAALQDTAVTLTDEGWEKYNEATGVYYDWVHGMLAQRDSGILYVRKDNTSVWYDTREDLLRQENMMLFDYPDLKTMFKLVFPDETFPYGPDDEYTFRDPALVKRFVDHFRQQDPTIVGVRVMGDNSLVTYTSTMGYYLGSYSISEQIALSIRQFHVKKAEGILTCDEQGRVTSMEANLEAEIQDVLGKSHTLQLNGDFQVSDYGTTQVVLPKPHDVEANEP